MDKNEKILRKLFSIQYLTLTREFPKIRDLPQREFAFFTWDQNHMIRHLGFNDDNILMQELKRLSPRHAYLSAAVYNDPSNKKMKEKEWEGCDFVIDIDSDHMELPCSFEHDYYFCQDPNNEGCNYFNNGKVPEKCPQCGGNKFKVQAWLCDECLGVSKNEVLKIRDFFINDFGIPEDQLYLKFSGHRGYHIETDSPRIRDLSSDERRQIVDYLTCTGFNPPDELKAIKGVFFGTTISEPGWRGKIANKFLELLHVDNSVEFMEFFDNYKIKDDDLSAIHDERKFLILNIKNNNPAWAISSKRISKTMWERIIKAIKDNIKCEVDIPVSIDVHRLIRLAGSIHGKTGFQVKPLNWADIYDFDPLNDAVLFSMDNDKQNTVRITSEMVPSIRIQNQIWGPYTKGEIINLPEAVAIFLACKGVGNIEK